MSDNIFFIIITLEYKSDAKSTVVCIVQANEMDQPDPTLISPNVLLYLRTNQTKPSVEQFSEKKILI